MLNQYAQASGQEINFQKSTIVFSPNTKSETRRRIQDRMNMRVDDKHEKYLGLPSIVGKSKKEVFDYLRERVWKRVEGWGEKMMSRVGKEVLIKSIIQAIPTYAMACFKLPDFLIKEIESTIARFWWGSGSSRKIHWLNWQKMCTGKGNGGMGFRDLRAFNLAMLSKQAWRIISNPDGLLSKLLKARYFPRCEFQEAKVGYCPSSTWRSIVATKELIDAGMRWRVGNGEGIRIWDDKWIPRPRTFKKNSPRPNGLENAKVCDLIDKDLGCWEKVEIEERFMIEDANQILAIPLGGQRNQDIKVWHYSKNGLFTVRSAYHLAMNIRRTSADRGSSSNSTSIENRDWKFIWCCKIPNKVKIFIWRACHDAIPTKLNLFRKRLSSDSLCNVCDNGDESTMHSLLHCDFARQTWACTFLPTRAIVQEASTTEEWMRKVRSRLDDDEIRIFFLCCWMIWNNRNKTYFEHDSRSPNNIAIFAQSYANEFLKANIIHSTSMHEESQAIWKPPEFDRIKINFDAAIFSDSCQIGLGVIARNYAGHCIAWRAKIIEGNFTPEMAEAMAARLACEMVRDHGWNGSMVEGDCKMVVSALNQRSQNLSAIGTVIQDAQDYIKDLQDITFNHVRRNCNKVAHVIARNVLELDFDSSDFPEVIRQAVTSDI